MNRAALVAFLTCLAASPVLANDTTAVLKTGGLSFTRSADITMEEEDLFISPTEVKVDYVFRNTSDKAIDTIVAFPMPAITGGPASNMAAGDPEADNFLNFTVVQDGVEIKPELQQRVFVADIDMTDVLVKAGVSLMPLSTKTSEQLAKLPKDVTDDLIARGLIMIEEYDAGQGMQKSFMPLWTLKSAYWWRTTYPAGKDVRVSHRYKPSVGGTVAITYIMEGKVREAEYAEYQKKYCIDDTFLKIGLKADQDMRDGKKYLYESWISYILTTGGNWYGPIKKFTLTVDKGDKANFVSFCGTGVKKIGPTSFQMTATDFYPERDLDILLLQPTQWQ